jgi:hypothetical protein
MIDNYSMVKFDKKIIHIINSKPKKKVVRMKIKNMKLAPTSLFQVPFNPEQIDRYKKISKYRCNDCLFQVLTALGLRHYTISRKDSRKIYKKQIVGVEVQDVANYLSTVFETTIKRNIYEDTDILPYLHLKNGYATFVCVSYLKKNKTRAGHFFIIYKHDRVIYCYDPCDGTNTRNINNIMDSTKIDRYVSFHNSLMTPASLNKNKINAPISY